MAKNILTLDYTEVFNYFMKSEQYCGFELPEYFQFDELLQYVSNKIVDIPYSECLSDILPDELEDANLNILLNKDGRYAVRPIVLANPYLYCFLVRELCNKESWKKIKECFSKFQVPHISSTALPIIKEEPESFHKSTTILNWWNTIEQRSLELSLEYKYMFITDITNCYGTVNPQTIDWALSLKNTEYRRDDNHDIAENIIKYLKAFQQGRNIGIPQGSAVFDFVGEIVLGYSDLLLHNKLLGRGIQDGYEILRYRDDYRIFCNDKDTLEQISYILQEVLESLNFRMNSQKTKISTSIVTDSVKADKLWYIENTPIFNKKGVDFDGIQKHLFYILLFSRKHQNSGQLKVMLSDLDKRIIEKLKSRKRKSFSILDNGDIKEFVDEMPGRIYENIHAISAVALQIAVENNSVTHYVLRIISRLVASLKEQTDRWAIVDKVYKRLCDRPNSKYDQLWLQNITYQRDLLSGESPYDLPLCRLVMGEDVDIWNNDWLKPELRTNIPLDTICNKEILETAAPIITFRETREYDDFLNDNDLFEEGLI
ncbi:MAG: RNA-directed DNA polymerase [Bacteroidales bacterium]|nr:RNA-directed DNA polymerase [Bacteroidales bacterium]